MEHQQSYHPQYLFQLRDFAKVMNYNTYEKLIKMKIVRSKHLSKLKSTSDRDCEETSNIVCKQVRLKFSKSLKLKLPQYLDR